MKRKIKTNIDLIKEIRNEWHINPVTRVHDENLKKSKKKMRLQGKKICKKGLGDNDSSPFALLLKCQYIFSILIKPQ